MRFCRSIDNDRPVKIAIDPSLPLPLSFDCRVLRPCHPHGDLAPSRPLPQLVLSRSFSKPPNRTINVRRGRRTTALSYPSWSTLCASPIPSSAKRPPSEAVAFPCPPAPTQALPSQLLRRLARRECRLRRRQPLRFPPSLRRPPLVLPSSPKTPVGHATPLSPSAPPIIQRLISGLRVTYHVRQLSRRPKTCRGHSPSGKFFS